MGDIRLSKSKLGDILLESIGKSIDFAEKYGKTDYSKKTLRLISYPINLMRTISEEGK